MEIVQTICLCFLLQTLQVSSVAHFTCSYPEDPKCIDAQRNAIKFHVSDSAELKKCPDSTSCFEAGSNIYVNSSGQHKGLYLEHYGELKVLASGTLQILNEKGLCKVADRSRLTIGGNLKIDSAHFYIRDSSVVTDYGTIQVGPDSQFYVSTFSQVDLSKVANLIMSSNSKLDMNTHSVLDMSEDIQNVTTQNVVMGDQSQIYMSKMSNIKLWSGSLEMARQTQLSVHDQANLELDGFIRIPNKSYINIWEQGELIIGQMNPSSMESQLIGNAEACLVISKENVGLSIQEKRKLVVKKGAYCIVKSSAILTSDLELNLSTKSDSFDCFSAKEDMEAAVLQLQH